MKKIEGIWKKYEASELLKDLESPIFLQVNVMKKIEDIWKNCIWRKLRVFEENWGYLKKIEGISRKLRVFKKNWGYLKKTQGKRAPDKFRKSDFLTNKCHEKNWGYLKKNEVEENWGYFKKIEGIWKKLRVFQENWGYLKKIEGILRKHKASELLINLENPIFWRSIAPLKFFKNLWRL